MNKKDRLLQSAIHLFAQDGINETSTGSVARAAGVAAGTLFNYFPTKNELVLSAYAECKLEMLRHIKTDLQLDLPFQELLHKIWQRVIAWNLTNLDKSDFMAQFKNSPGTFDAQLDESVEAEFVFFRVALQQAEKDGIIVSLPAEYLDRIFSALHGATIDYLRSIQKREHPRMIQESFALLWRILNRN